MAESEGPSYIDYDTFLDPDFSPTAFANSLVIATNNPSDTPIDLSTPLSRVLFDIQEIDTHIHTLTTQSAIPLLTHTKAQADAGQRIVTEVEAQVANLTNGYQRLEKEVIQRYEEADQVRVAVERLWETVRIGRAVARCLTLGRQLETQMAEATGAAGGSNSAKKEDHRAMVRATNTLLTVRHLLSASGPNEEGEHLSKVILITYLQNSILTPSETALRNRAQQIIREFSMSSLASSATAPTTYDQSEETKSRTTSALLTLQLLNPRLLVAALQTYLRASLTSSLASVGRALNSLPTLDRSLLEVSARCQNIVALEKLLGGTKPPQHPQSRSNDLVEEQSRTLLEPLLAALDTSSLPSFFWRSLAEGLGPRVADLVIKGGVVARALKSQRERVKDSIRECVLRGSQSPGHTTRKAGAWEREAAVMVGSVMGPLGR
ncbi:Conserved oligomeric Golgi complex subunit [Xanthoria parietina]